MAWYLVHLTVIAAAAACAAATTCPKSGITQPGVITLAIDLTSENTIDIVTDTCNETPISAIPSDTDGELEIDAGSKGIVSVESYRPVQNLQLWGNSITSFKAYGTTLKELDLKSNGLVSLSGFSFPSSLIRLTLDQNAIASTKSSNFPENLQTLLMRDNSITSLSGFAFPDKLQSLDLSDNTKLTTLRGAVLPASLQSLECSDCAITIVQGMILPLRLTKITLGGADVVTFEIRKSDVSTFNTLAISGTIVPATNCTNNATLKTIKVYSICVLDDDIFASLYPEAFAKEPSSSRSEASSGSNANSSHSDGSTSKTKVIYITLSVVIFVLVCIVCPIGWFICRRKRNTLSELQQPLAEAEYTTTHDTSSSGNAPSATSGYLTNDVRNDELLIAHRLPQDEIMITKKLASGGFGVVYLGVFAGQLVAIKRQARGATKTTEELCQFMNEIRLYARLEHRKIVRFIGLSWTNLFDLSLITEYMPNGDLSSLLRELRLKTDYRQTFTWFHGTMTRSKILIAIDIAEALVYLHSFEQPIIHRDLKCKSVLLTADYEAKLCDFGVSRERLMDSETMTGCVGTTAWMAPEVLCGERYSEMADVYSMGLLLSEMDTCGHPYNGDRDTDDMITDANIAVLVSTNSIKPNIHSDCPTELHELILQCVAFEPAERPTALKLHYRLRQIRSTGGICSGEKAAEN